jgi:glycine betaine/proline transport system substrate-binding protein
MDKINRRAPICQHAPLSITASSINPAAHAGLKATYSFDHSQEYDDQRGDISLTSDVQSWKGMQTMDARNALIGGPEFQARHKASGPARVSLTKRLLLIAGAGAMVGATAWGQSPSMRPVVLGQVSLSFYAVTGAVVQEVLERLGHRVEVRQGPHQEIFPLLADRQVDLMAAVWLPEGHSEYWQRYGSEAQEVARLYEGARFFWAVPSYVHEVGSIQDLAKPSVAARMMTLIQGIGTGATITIVSRKAIDEYSLSPLGYSLRAGTQSEWIAAFNSAITERRWIVFPTWAPQYLNREGQLRALADPRGVLGGVNHGALVGPREHFQMLPEATRRALARIEIGLEGVTEMDWLVNVERLTPLEAARKWMRANEKRVSGWLRA